MADDFSLPIDEARARMLRQADLVTASEALQEGLGTTWGGSYIDHESDGALVVQTTSPEIAAPAVDDTLSNLSQDGGDTTSSGSELVRVREVEASVDDLEAAVRAAHRSIPAQEGAAFVAAGASVSATVDVIDNTVDVIVEMPVGATADLQEAVMQRAATLVVSAENAEGSVRGEVAIEVEGETTPANCSPVYSLCNPALRGGQGIRALSNCTLGLPVRSKSDRRPYILTAGHCFAGQRTRNFDYWAYVPGDWPATRDIGDGHNFVHRTSSTSVDDYGIVSATRSGHVTESRVFVETQNGSRSTSRNEWYDIRGTGNIGALPADSYLCHTGFTTGTRCGRFTGTSRGLGRYAAFVCGGDSGGPVYAQNRLYGIVYGGRNTTTQDRYRGLSTDPASVSCSNDALYQGAGEALNDLNVEIF